MTSTLAPDRLTSFNMTSTLAPDYLTSFNMTSTSAPNRLTSFTRPLTSFNTTSTSAPDRRVQHLMRHLTAGRRPSPYLQGNYAPIDKEIVATNLPVQGILPSGLSGRYYRTGSNPSKSFEDRPYHWFDGDGMTHAVTFETDGTVTYRNAWVRTHRFHRAALEGKCLAPIGEAMRGNPTVMMELMEEDASEEESFGLMHGTGNTAMLSHAGRIFALHEGDRAHEIDPITLATLGRADFGGKVSHRFSAHPKVCGVTGDCVCFGATPDAKMHISVISSSGEVTLSNFPVQLRAPVVMHGEM